MSRPFFTRERISDFDIYDKNCASTLKLATTRLEEGYPVEVQVPIFFLFFFFIGSSTHPSLILLNNTCLLCVTGSSCPIHIRLCYSLLVRTRRRISISEHPLSTICGPSKQTLILQPPFYRIRKSIRRRTESHCRSVLFRQRLASY